MRGGIAAIAIAGSAFIAAGCGGGGSGSSEAAKESAALDYVPATALAYVTVDTDFTGEGWSQFSDLATVFDADFDPIDEQIAEASKDGDEEVDFQEDVDPWLGQSGGLAVLSVKSDESHDAMDKDAMEDHSGGAFGGAEMFVWVEVDDREALEAFAEDQGFEKGDDAGDFSIWTEGDDNAIAMGDDLALFAETPEQLEAIVDYDGDSIRDSDGIDDAIDGLDGDALGTLVISGDGLRAAAKEDEDLASFAEAEQLKDFEAFALSIAAEDDGFRLAGNAVSASEGSAENIEHPIFLDLPDNTVLAIGGGGLGGLVKSVAEGAGKGNPQVQQGIGAVTAVLGVSLDDLEETMDGEFVLGLASDDEGLGALAGGVAGAAMGGGTSSLDPGQILQAGTLLLAFEETGKTGDTLKKVAGSAGALAGGGAAPKTGTSGDFETSTMSVQGLPITLGTTDEVAAVSLGLDVFDGWGGDTLGELDSFTNAWDAADAPDESVSAIWFDAGRVATLAGLEGAEDKQLGGLVGWSVDDGAEYEIGMFLHVESED